MDWRCGSSSREPDLQVPSTDFNPQSHQKQTQKTPTIQMCSAKHIKPTQEENSLYFSLWYKRAGFFDLSGRSDTFKRSVLFQ
jgi:hypothetical protein